MNVMLQRTAKNTPWRGLNSGEDTLNDAVRGPQVGKRRDRDQPRSLLMLDPSIVYILASCMVILAVGVASGDFS
jgi:hypothetical protein